MVDQGNQLKQVPHSRNAKIAHNQASNFKKVTNFCQKIHLEKFEPYANTHTQTRPYTINTHITTLNCQTALNEALKLECCEPNCIVPNSELWRHLFTFYWTGGTFLQGWSYPHNFNAFQPIEREDNLNLLLFSRFSENFRLTISRIIFYSPFLW